MREVSIRDDEYAMLAEASTKLQGLGWRYMPLPGQQYAQWLPPEVFAEKKLESKMSDAVAAQLASVPWHARRLDDHEVRLTAAHDHVKQLDSMYQQSSSGLQRQIDELKTHVEQLRVIVIGEGCPWQKLPIIDQLAAIRDRITELEGTVPQRLKWLENQVKQLRSQLVAPGSSGV